MPALGFFALLIPLCEVILIIAAIIALFYLTVALKIYIRKNR
jgi:hypothetical protein